jgi:Holliday junction resolvasome RuvABC endonuclease subunit
MRVLGIDPHGAKPYGFAILDREDGLPYSRVFLSGLCDLGVLYGMIREFKPDVVAIEDQYMNKNYKVAKSLSWSAGKVMGAAELAHTEWMVVNVATWKSVMQAQKGTHIARAAELFGGKFEDDEASAVLIAAYAIGQKGT